MSTFTEPFTESRQISLQTAYPMRRALIAFEIIVFFLLCYYSLYLATDYLTPHGRHDMPTLIWIIDTVDLFIHEGGHGIFRFFGQFLYFLGGSLIQFIIPVTTIIVFLRTSGPRSLMATLFWLGENMLNVSVYIEDAPKQQLTLISRHALHDWRWLCNSMGIMDWSGELAEAVAIFGTLTLLGAIGVTLYFIVYDIRAEFFPAPPPRPMPPGLHPRTRSFIPPIDKHPQENNTLEP